MPTQRQFLQSVARKGTGGDTDLAHVTRGDVVIPIEIQSDPLISAGLRGMFVKAGLDKKRFTVGTGKRNRKTGLQAFALDPSSIYYQALASGQLGISPPAATSSQGLGPSGAKSTAAAPTVGDQAVPSGDLPPAVGGLSLSDLVNQLSAGGGDLGNPNAGQPGSAGFGPGKTAADAIMGLVGGAIAPGFGTLSLAAQALTNPNFDLKSALSFGLLGNQNAGFPGAITDPNMIANMSIDPSAYGLVSGPVGQLTSSTSPDQLAAQQAALDALAGLGASDIGAGSNVGGVAAGGAIGALGGAGEAGILGGGGVSIGGGGIGGGVDSGGSGTGVGGTGAGSDSTGAGLGGTGAAGGLT